MVSGGRDSALAVPSAVPSGASAIIGRYADNLAGKTKAAQFMAHAQRWFAVGRPALRHGAAPMPEDVSAYVAGRRRQGMKDSTIAGELAAVKRMYSLSGTVAPVGVARLRRDSESGPALGRAAMLQLIQWAKGPRVPPLTRGYVAVSTLYGARAGELGAIRMEDVDLEGGRIYLWTQKDGARRWQRIPPEAAWALRVPWRRLSAAGVAERFHAACYGAGIPRKKGDGWHTGRHGLALALKEAGVALEARHAFMRWAGGRGGQDIADYYAGSGVIIEPTGRRRREQADLDAETWSLHPFVAAWSR